MKPPSETTANKCIHWVHLIWMSVTLRWSFRNGSYRCFATSD